jgi:hypothetical protein
MADIHISRSGTTLGIFPEEEVREGLRTTRFAATDLGWREGMSTWLPLAQFPEFATTGAPPVAAGAIPSVSPALSAPDAAPVARTGLPWDRRQELGFLNAFIETLKLVLLNPALAFATMKTEGGLTEPLIYGLIGGSAGFIVYFLFSMFLTSFGFMGSKDPLAGLMGLGFGTIFILIFMPVLLAAGLFIGAGIVHLCLTLVGGARRSFETTFRVVCFATGSAYPLMMIPFCGGLISGVWNIVLECIGLARAHETTTGRAALAVFLPLIVCCAGGLLVALMFGVFGMAGHH